MKIRVQAKKQGNRSEKTALLKIFKYFDLMNEDLLDFGNWSKSLEKLSLAGYSLEESKAVFRHYARGNSKLNYKEFIAEFFQEGPKREHSLRTEYSEPSETVKESVDFKKRKFDTLIKRIRAYLLEEGLKTVFYAENKFKVGV